MKFKTRWIGMGQWQWQWGRTLTAGFFGLALAASSANAAKSVPVKITEGDQTFSGDLYFPNNAKTTKALPLVAVVHEWWGKTEHPQKRAQRIADQLGYAALVVDFYGDAKTVDTPKEAGALATPFYKDPMKGVKRLRAFVAAAPEAAKKAGVSLDLSKVAAIGFCFGGTQVLNLSRAGGLESDDATLRGVVSFHGGLESSLKADDPITAKVLVLHGAADKMVPDEQVAAFKKEMAEAKADLTFVAYPGALHAFTNPKATVVGKKHGIPVAYDAKADKKSWAEMRRFLKGLLEG